MKKTFSFLLILLIAFASTEAYALNSAQEEILIEYEDFLDGEWVRESGFFVYKEFVFEKDKLAISADNRVYYYFGDRCNCMEVLLCHTQPGEKKRIAFLILAEGYSYITYYIQK